MKRYWLVFVDAGSVWGGTGWHLVVPGQYNLVLLGIKWNWASTRLLCLYILKKKWRFGRMSPQRDGPWTAEMSSMSSMSSILNMYEKQEKMMILGICLERKSAKSYES